MRKLDNMDKCLGLDGNLIRGYFISSIDCYKVKSEDIWVEKTFLHTSGIMIKIIHPFSPNDTIKMPDPFTITYTTGFSPDEWSEVKEKLLKLRNGKE